MKKIIINLLILVLCIGLAQAQEVEKNDSLDKKYLKKVSSIDATIKTLYEVISGEKGEERNWELLKYLFHPKVQMIASGKNREGKIGIWYASTEGYIERSGKWLVENGFFEEELYRTTEEFGHMAQVFSTYQTFHHKNDSKPFMRGINSIQLLHDGDRWWVVNIYWAQETPDNPIPKKYLLKE